MVSLSVAQRSHCKYGDACHNGQTLEINWHKLKALAWRFILKKTALPPQLLNEVWLHAIFIKCVIGHAIASDWVFVIRYFVGCNAEIEIKYRLSAAKVVNDHRCSWMKLSSQLRLFIICSNFNSIISSLKCDLQYLTLSLKASMISLWMYAFLMISEDSFWVF